jgi:hypothetical protein
MQSENVIQANPSSETIREIKSTKRIYERDGEYSRKHYGTCKDNDNVCSRGCNADMRDKARSNLRNRCSSSYHRGSGRGDRHAYSWQQCTH